MQIKANFQILKRKEQLIEENIQSDKFIQSQYIDNLDKDEERKQFELNRRKEKNAIRDYLQQRTAYEYSQTKSRGLNNSDVPISECTTRMDQERAATAQIRIRRAEDRKDEYQNQTRNQLLTGKDLGDYDFLQFNGNQDKEQAFKTKMEKSERERTRDFQIGQITARRNKENKERTKTLNSKPNSWFLGPDSY